MEVDPTAEPGRPRSAARHMYANGAPLGGVAHGRGSC